MKPEEILEFLKNHKELEALIIDKNGKEYLSNGIKQYLEKIDEK
jgi:thiamine biosynthesis lipoprotein ApbE